MRPLYVIGDIHGQIDLLEDAISLVHDDGGVDAQIVFVGDLIDRGPDSRAVIETLMEAQAEGEPWIVLMGNHDRFLLRFLRNPHYRDMRTTSKLTWLDDRIGGRTTLASYGVDAGDDRDPQAIRDDALGAIPEAHRAWLADLPKSYETRDHIFVHAGLRPGVPLNRQTEDDLLWIRKEFLEDETDHGRLVVHGHTPVDFPVLTPNRLNTDTGAGYGNPLVPVRLLGRRAHALTETGAVRL